jgi:hypothetical protein
LIGDHAPRYDVLLEKSAGSRKSAHRNVAVKMTTPGLPTHPRSRIEVDRSELDVPWLVAHALSGPFDQGETPTAREPKVGPDADKLLGNERVAALVTLACHLLERLWVSSRQWADARTEADTNAAETKLLILQLKEVIARPCLGGEKQTSSAPAGVVRTAFDRYCEIIDALTGNQRLESRHQFDLGGLDRFAWLLISIVVFRLTKGEQDSRLPNDDIDPRRDRICLPLGRAIQGRPNFAIWHDLPSLVGLSSATLIDALKRLLAAVSIDAPGLSHVNLKTKHGYWSLAGEKRSAN